MKSEHRLALACSLFAGLTVSSSFAAAPTAGPTVAATGAPDASVPDASCQAVLAKLFAALEREDQATFDAVTTPDFRAFEGGKIFNRAALMSLIQQVHRAGRHYRWSVTDQRVEQDQHVAVINYVNRGVINDGGTQVLAAWLEVASFTATPGGWKINFLASQRVATPPKAG